MKKILTILLLLTIATPAYATVLFVPQGGTGASTLTGCLTGHGTSAITGVGTCATFAWPFTKQADGSQATSTLLSLFGGLFTNASSTIVSTTFLANGSVGIGTTTPFKTLDITNSTNDVAINFNNGTSNYGQIGFALGNSKLISGDTNGDLVIRNSVTGKSIILGTESTEALRITNAGNVNLVAALLVNGSTTLQAFTAKTSTTTNATTTTLATGTLCLTADTCRTTWPTSGSSFGYPFGVATNGTTTLVNFFGGLGTSASSTIGAGGTGTGLTIFGGATTTGDSLHLGSTTLQNFTAKNATTSQATTTNLAVTSLSADTLVAANKSGGLVSTSTIGNAQLQNSAITVNTSAPLGGGAAVSLGGSVSLTCTGCLTGMTFQFPFTTFSDWNTHNATSTLIGFKNGLYSLASSTIGANTTGGGLTIFGGATTTGQFLALGSTTLQLFTANQSTTTQATTTNFAITGITSKILYASPTGAITPLLLGTNLTLTNGTLSASGGGGGPTTPFATTTSQNAATNLIYTTTNTDLFTIGGASTSTAKFWVDPNISAPTYVFQVASTTPGSGTGSSTLFGITPNGHISSTSTAPTVSTCGTGATVTGTDSFGIVTPGTSQPGVCLLKFNVAYANAPVCQVSSAGYASGGKPWLSFVGTTTTAQLSVMAVATSTGATTATIAFPSFRFVYDCKEVLP